MIYCDSYVQEFMKYNMVTITFLFSLLKLLAARNESFPGDSIIDLIKSIFVKK